MKLDTGNVSLAILILISVVTMALLAWNVISGTAVSQVTMTLLGVVLGFLGSHLSSAQGASQALSTPPSSSLGTESQI